MNIKQNTSSPTGTSNHSSEYYRLSDTEIEDLRIDAKETTKIMLVLDDNPAWLATISHQAREKILARKPHLRIAVELLLKA